MISNFALLLSHEGIKLAHRTPDGWAELGHVGLLEDDLSDKLEELRVKGESLAVKNFSTKIVLPNDQIKYLTLPSVDDDAREAAIKDALEKTTPYLIEDMVYDWEDGEDGMNIAAVARDTLTEAEAFLTQYGFNPTSFVAAPDDALFSVEPFFGTCANVADNEDIADSIEAEVDKVILTVSDEAPMAEAVDVEPSESDESNSEDETDEVETAETEIADEDDKQDDPDEKAQQFKIAPLVADRDDDHTHLDFPLLGPATETSILRGMEPAIKPAPRIGIGAEDDEDVKDRSFPSWAGGTKRIKSASTEDDVETTKIGWLKASSTQDEEETTSPPSWMQTDEEPVEPEDEPEFEEEQEAAAWVPASQAAAIKQPLFDQVETEAEKLEIFGNRGERTERAAIWNPVWIGAIIVALLLFIGGSFFGIRYFTSSPDPVIAEEQEAEPSAIAVSEPDEQDLDTDSAIEAETNLDETTDVTAPEGAEDAVAEIAETTSHEGAVVPEDAPAEPVDEAVVEAEQETAPAPEEPQQAVEETVAPQEQILTEAPSAADIAPARPVQDEPEELAEVAEETAPQAEDIQGQSEVTESDVSENVGRLETEWSNLSVEARDARYAATGIWPMAPDSPIPPVGESVGALFLATVDPVVFATDAYAITPEAEMLSDKALTSQPNPPAQGTRFERDERGLVAATPEGAVTPDGIAVYAGIPPQLPPLAPRPDPVAQQAEQRAALVGKIPQLRPDLEVEAESEPEAAEDFEPTANAIPPLRPASIAALAEQPVAPLNPLALERTPMPRLRPTNIGEIVYNTERATVAAQTTTAVAPSNVTVGNSATEEDAISLRGINLIGIYGESGDRRALVRLQSGRYTKIEVGDRLNGGQVTAIDDDRVLYVRNGQTIVLRMPSP